MYDAADFSALKWILCQGVLVYVSLSSVYCGFSLCVSHFSYMPTVIFFATSWL